MIMYYLKLYLSAFVAFLAIDMVWLTVVARGFYRRQLGFLQIQFNLWAAFAFYLLFVAGLLVFVIVPAVEAGSFARPCFWALSLAWSPMRPTI